MRTYTLLLALAASLLVAGAATADDDISKDDGIVYLQSTVPGCAESFNVYRVGNEIEIEHKAFIDSQWVEINDKDYFVNGVDGIHFVGDDDSDGLHVNGWSSSAKVEIPVIAYGLGGDDTLRGGATTCILYGGPGEDVLIGSYGNDYLDPGEGAAHVFGWGGADVFVHWQQYAWDSRLEEWSLEIWTFI